MARDNNTFEEQTMLRHKGTVEEQTVARHKGTVQTMAKQIATFEV